MWCGLSFNLLDALLICQFGDVQTVIGSFCLSFDQNSGLMAYSNTNSSKSSKPPKFQTSLFFFKLHHVASLWNVLWQHHWGFLWLSRGTAFCSLLELSQLSLVASVGEWAGRVRVNSFLFKDKLISTINIVKLHCHSWRWLREPVIYVLAEFVR